ncbi:general stress protein [Agrococcus sp. KRD186]|uniref:general stress protein n=1 Tax=Agrococcus sp. KRD186 TaxID=2729730 RepID=UPI001F4978B3|nr:general stress protein [Agrococcus sp. KRD186]
MTDTQNPMQGRTAPTPPSTTIAEFDTYEQAQALVDRLSDAKFAVEHVRIVGTGLRTVEQVLGRMTYGRAALGGAMAGAWFGLFVGLLFALIGAGGWVWLIWALLMGAAFGMIAAVVQHAMTGGKRDFTSVQALKAERYGVQVTNEHAAEAVRVMGQPAPTD